MKRLSDRGSFPLVASIASEADQWALKKDPEQAASGKGKLFDRSALAIVSESPQIKRLFLPKLGRNVTSAQKKRSLKGFFSRTQIRNDA